MIEPIKISLGSKNAAKIASVLKAAQQYWGEHVTVTGLDIESGVPAQPLGHEQTQQGAINRAIGALAANPGADLGVGQEGGVIEMAGHPVLMGYIAVTDGKRTVVVPSTGVALPRSWGDALIAGAELRPLIQSTGLPYEHSGAAFGTLTSNACRREDVFTFATMAALAPWVNPVAYEAEPAQGTGTRT